MKCDEEAVSPLDEKISIARKFGANKYLGQHFLVDDTKLQTVCNTLGAHKGDSVLEIGPGLGFLTKLLDATGAYVLAVDIDMRSVRYLETLSLPNTKVQHADILQFKIDPELGKLKVVGNIPYQITAPILVHMLGELGTASPWLKQIELIVLTVQREVAQRLIAKPGSKAYGQITLLLNYFASIELIDEIPAECFYPAPEVDSSIIKITPLKHPAVECNNPKVLRSVIVAGFSSRRKMLKNNLSALFGADNCTRIFDHLNLDPQSRAENLSLQQYAQLADELSSSIEK